MAASKTELKVVSTIRCYIEMEQNMSDTMLLGVLRIPKELWTDSEIDQLQRESHYKEAAERIEVMTDVLDEINKLNELNNDRDDYLYNLAEWAITGSGEKPKLGN